MDATKEKNDKIKVMHHSMAGIVLEDLNLMLLRGQAALKVLIKPLYAVRSTQKFLESCLRSSWEKRQQKAISRRLNPKKILDALERFGPGATHNSRLHYTMGVEFMAEECCAWNLIMAIKPIFEMLGTGKYPVAIKLQGNRGNRTKITYYDGIPGSCVPGDEYIEMAFPLKKLVLFYAGGVLMLANEYHRMP